jgi:hypothetical protein
VTADRKGFHSFRKNAAQALKDARATPAEIAEVIEHEKGFTLSVYVPLALTVDALQELMERIRFDGLRPRLFARLKRQRGAPLQTGAHLTVSPKEKNCCQSGTPTMRQRLIDGYGGRH